MCLSGLYLVSVMFVFLVPFSVCCVVLFTDGNGYNSSYPGQTQLR